MTAPPSFRDFFEALWKQLDPFPWQEMLAERIVADAWPKALDLPTAAGKTACIDVAIWALACQADRALSERTAPRRIWFVVDRRIVVDEAFARASKIAEALMAATGGPLKKVADRLRQMSGTERPVAVARLRGGVLRDDGWARLPSQPAVITSTVDQLGSRLLFRGYGRSHLTAPIFAGLAANDSLILLDEAHCSVPFLQTLRAVERFRGEGWAECPVKTPFAFAILSATPPPDIPSDAVFPGSERDEALDHSVLHDRMRASKPAELVVLKTERSEDEGQLVAEAAERARSYVDECGKRRVAIIVNRVRTAGEVAETLRSQVGESVDIVLLTGRLRPFERDRLVERWKPVLRAHEPTAPEKPIVLVSTQCIEVGADFSFDALVTEAASLDALRQRFGRLKRMGTPVPSPASGEDAKEDVKDPIATILIRAENTKEDITDPIYGGSIAACWRLLEKKASTGTEKNSPKSIDFGIEALDGLLADVEDLSPYLAPTPAAPTLLPAHLDLLCQTAPIPYPEPDIQLFLHGAGRGAPEARVIWRADLDVGNPEVWEETIALCPPASAEALSVPLFRLQQWLADSDAVGDVADVEGADVESAVLAEGNGGKRIRPVLLWAGRERSRLVSRAADVGPNDVVVVPADYGIQPVGQSEPTEALGRAEIDIWEVARVGVGRLPALRLHRAVLEPWLDCPAVRDLVTLAADPTCDRASLQESIDAVLAYQRATEDGPAALPRWLSDLLHKVRHGRVEQHPSGGLVLFARQSDARQYAEPDLFADDDDLLSATGQEVSLAVHSGSVTRAAEKLASRCLALEFLEPLRTAADWHDVGKLDERFQVLLRQGDELAAIAGEPLAKSAEIPSSPARRRSIREASGLPQHFRHEMLSLQLAGQYAPLPEAEEVSDLILHLVASHHGYARPFTPVSSDPTPPAVRETHCGVPLDLSAVDRAALTAPHAVGSGISERFWHLTRRYGWWGLAYLEAILRMGDWYGSQFIAAEASDQEPALRSVLREQVPVPGGTAEPIVLSGIDGANPLGFLTALGTLAVLHTSGHRDARLHWTRTATWQPVLSGIATDGPAPLKQLVAEALSGDELVEDAEGKRDDARRALDAARKEVKVKLDEIKKRGLRGKQRKEAIEAEVKPLERKADKRRQGWLTALRQAVPRPELALGKHIDCTAAEYRTHADRFLDEASIENREALDFLAAFASDARLSESDAQRKKGILASTPFCFITGSGQQYFLDTVRQLMDPDRVSAERVGATLFEPWLYAEERFSMRWDPVEDRRYALMDRDPTASDNKSRTVWMANLLAYRALVLFPSAPTRSHLATAAWNRGRDEFTWPIWRHPSDPDTIRSMLLLPELRVTKPDHGSLRAQGVVAVFRARRIKVGAGANFKINFSPARGV